MLRIDLYKNKNQESRQYGKVYGRVKNNEPMDIYGLAKHIAMHGSQYTRDVIQGVLLKAADCVKELVLTGQPVKFADLCIFKASAVSTPAVSVEKFDLSQNIKKIRLQCRATGETNNKVLTAEASLGYTTMAERLKAGEATLSNEKGKYLEDGE
jgi:hypothetical protein